MNRKSPPFFRRITGWPALLRGRRRADRARDDDGQFAATDEEVAETLADTVIQIESAGNAELFIPATGALGPGQFLESTWLKLIEQFRPELTAVPKGELLARRTDRALSREMVVHLLVQNSRLLRASGFAPIAANLYLAHFLGLPGAIRTLAAPADTPIIDLVGPAPVAHNAPILEGKTASEVRDWADRSVRVAALAAGGHKGRGARNARTHRNRDLF